MHTSRTFSPQRVRQHCRAERGEIVTKFGRSRPVVSPGETDAKPDRMLSKRRCASRRAASGLIGNVPRRGACMKAYIARYRADKARNASVVLNLSIVGARLFSGPQ